MTFEYKGYLLKPEAGRVLIKGPAGWWRETFDSMRMAQHMVDVQSDTPDEPAPVIPLYLENTT